ncbi:3-methyladenine DNA glycosylase AlkC [Flavobacterium sp. 28YEA47A]|uniref:DNA alkylation repair protein n=1 Tax=Flavobacterium sp. 28YEA47A TaxID=3156276 RepID=UPI003511390C
MAETKRKGARSAKDIPKAILEQLNAGKIETANLVEWLAVDQKILLKNLLEEKERISYLALVLEDIERLKKQTVNTINETIGKGLYKQALQGDDSRFLMEIVSHPSDLVRCWTTYYIASDENCTLEETLELIKPFAADSHFGVREISWLSVRKLISEDISQSIKILSEWTKSKDENVRRFASEATRPRGVWCEHIELLKQQPELGLPILEPMRSDKAKYVQDSIGNWLNDASKSQPKFVMELCERWCKESPCKETDYIIKKALRTIEKKA